jgi:uncharacterized protein YggU (UPF0235/DUF167 family)
MIIKVKVKPNSGRNEFIIEKDYCIAYVKERAENNRANESLVLMIAKKYGVSKKKVRIKNPKSRKKIIDIDI